MFRPRQPESTASLVACIYARVSTDEQVNNTSLSNQIERSQGLANYYKLIVPDSRILREDESGMTMDRPQLHLLREWVRKRQIDAVIVNSSDRLSRKPGHAEELLDEMQSNGVRLFIVMHAREFDLNNPTDRNQILMEMGFNRQWHHMLVEVMKSGRHRKSLQGKVVGYGGAKFGFTKFRNSEGDNELAINDDEASVIQDIFAYYVKERVGVIEIQRRLRGIPSPIDRKAKGNRKKERKFGEWNQTTIYNILRDPAYMGRFEQMVNGEPTYAAVPVIVDPDIWEEAQQILDKGKKYSVRNSKHPFLMARRLTCGDCNRACATQFVANQAHTGTFYYYYVCATYKNAAKYPGGRCSLPKFDGPLIDDVVWGWVTDVASDPRGLATKLEESKRNLDAYNAPLLARLKQIETTRAKQYNKVDMLAEMYSPADVKAKPELRAMFERLREETEHLLEDLRAQEDEVREKLAEATITQEFIRSWEKHAHKIRDKMHEFTFEERRKSIESLNITGTLAVENGVKVLYIHLYNHTDRIPLDNSGDTHGSEPSQKPSPPKKGGTSTHFYNSKNYGAICRLCPIYRAASWQYHANAASSSRIRLSSMAGCVMVRQPMSNHCANGSSRFAFVGWC